MPRKNAVNLAQLRDRLETGGGKRYWRSLQELAETDEFRQYLECEFPEQAAAWSQQPNRREFLKLMGASLALAGLQGCHERPREPIVPYVEQPELIVPGRPLYYATAIPFQGYARGVLVESHLGRPTKIEGNLEHPLTRGKTDAFTQASILDLYDPDRSQVVTYLGNITSWGRFLTDIREELNRLEARQGEGLRILSESFTSPTLREQRDQLLERFPKAKWHQYDAVGRENVQKGSRMAFGEDVETIYRFDRADVILSLDSDFLTEEPGSLRYARDFIDRRRIVSPERNQNRDAMNRLYVVESTVSLTGAMADHRLPIAAHQVESFARLLASRLGVGGTADQPDTLHADIPSEWIDALVDDLRNYRLDQDPGTALVIAGPSQPPSVHLLAHAMNDILESSGEAVVQIEPVSSNSSNSDDETLAELVEDIRNGEVDVLLILGGNPVFSAPADLEFANALQDVRLRVHLGAQTDETSRLCHWHIPQSHPLEAWGDARTFDGTASIIQPLIAPLYSSRSVHEVLSVLLGQPGQSAYDAVREHWRRRFEQDRPADPDRPADEDNNDAAPERNGDPNGNNHQDSEANAQQFEQYWQRAVHDGIVPGTEARRADVSFRQDALDAMPNDSNGQSQRNDRQQSERRNNGNSERTGGPSIQDGTFYDDLEVVFRPDPSVWDGRFANNGWLQELPKPFTKLTWDNPLLVGFELAEQLGLETEDLVELEIDGQRVTLPVWITPGLPARSMTILFGNGRRRVGRVGTQTGFDTYLLRSMSRMWSVRGISIRKTGEHHPLATTQLHHLMEGRDLVRGGTLEELQTDPEHPSFMELDPHAALGHEEQRAFYPEFPYDGYKWGMVVDQTACIGCNACVVACQAENNIPIVGKSEVRAGREMHWLRIDTYFEGPLENPQTHFQPMLCMHCEKAPCEVVCPVVATVHSDEGLNEMVYNRCVGTRYCSNNCPYKVRRFNYFDYTSNMPDQLRLMQNPNVTVRSRGVMEKCTYCVQRISAGRIEAEKEGRSIVDGEVRTACQDACPTDAIIFGDLNDSESRVVHMTNQPINYSVLGDLNTQPRTRYLADLRNPNPKLSPVQNGSSRNNG